MGVMRKIEKKTKGRIWLIPALICTIFAGGQFCAPFVVWLYPLLLYRVATYEKKNSVLTYILLFLVIYVGSAIHYQYSLLGEPWYVSALVVLVYPLFFIWAIVIPAILYRKLENHNVFRILVYPCIWVVIEYGFSYLGFGSVFSISSTQEEFYSFSQCASIFGVFGLSFVMVLVSSIICDIWNHKFMFSKFKFLGNEVLSIVIVLILCFSYGSIRLALNPPSSDTTRVASVLNFYGTKDFVSIEEGLKLYSDEHVNESLAYMEKDVVNAKNQGASIIMWQEICFNASSSNIDHFLDKASSIAKQNNIAMVIPLDYLEARGVPRLNQAIFINKDGNVDFRYDKVNLVPIVETFDMKEGEPTLCHTKVDDIKVGVAICYDALNPQFIRAYLHEDTDLLLVPALEWESIANYIGTSSMFRSVEHGVSYIRNTGAGIVFSCDQFGRPLNYYNSLGENPGILYIDLPADHVVTIYQYIGDLVVYLSILFFAFIVIFVIVNCRKSKVRSKQ